MKPILELCKFSFPQGINNSEFCSEQEIVKPPLVISLTDLKSGDNIFGATIVVKNTEKNFNAQLGSVLYCSYDNVQPMQTLSLSTSSGGILYVEYLDSVGVQQAQWLFNPIGVWTLKEFTLPIPSTRNSLIVVSNNFVPNTNETYWGWNDIYFVIPQ